MTMPLETTHLEYPKRRYGMDHDRYEWSMLANRPPVAWPGGASVAVWFNVSLQHFPLNPSGKPVKLPGSMSMPYPDLRHYTLRDYGNRVGVYRFLDAFARHGITPSFAINACLVERYPALIDAIVAFGGEILGHSWSMDTPHAGGLERAQESELVARALATLRGRTGAPVRGWLSPGKLQSANTPEILRENEIEYFCDWVNDELPYRFHTASGDLWSLPLSTELEDRFVVLENQHSEASWAQQVIDAFQFLLDEAQGQGGRLLTVSLHPWVMGQPHRIKHLETVLAHVAAEPRAWCASPSAILAAFSATAAPAKAEE